MNKFDKYIKSLGSSQRSREKEKIVWIIVIFHHSKSINVVPSIVLAHNFDDKE